MAKFLQRMWALVRGKELVGKDNAGNVFYRHSTTVDGAVTERRWVEYVGEPNPRNLPAEWYSWLIGRRKDAPTEEDIMALEAYRQRVKMNATIVEKEEEKRRFRQKSLQQDGNLDTMKPPDMSRFVQQVAALEGVSFDGGDKASMTSAHETPTLEETRSHVHAAQMNAGCLMTVVLVKESKEAEKAVAKILEVKGAKNKMFMRNGCLRVRTEFPLFFVLGLFSAELKGARHEWIWVPPS